MGHNVAIHVGERELMMVGLRRYSVESRRFLELTLERLSYVAH